MGVVKQLPRGRGEGRRSKSSGAKHTPTRRDVRGQDAKGYGLPVQGIEERTLQVSRREIDRPEDGGREDEVGGEPAAMLSDVKVFERSARARQGVSTPVTRPCVMGFRHQQLGETNE